MDLPLRASGEPFAAFDTDLGYRVTLQEVTVPLRDLQLTGIGEEHVSLPERAWSWLVPVAHAHPGHGVGGAVMGERVGAFDARFGMGDDATLGDATVLAAPLHGANFLFQTAPAVLDGEATRDGERFPFRIEVHPPEDAKVEGVALRLDVTGETRGALRLRLLPVSVRGRSLLDAVDFEQLDDVTAQNAVGRALQDHAHYELVFEAAEGGAE